MAYGQLFYAANINTDAINAWVSAYDTIDGMMDDVAKGKRGSMDLESLRNLEMSIRGMAVWFDGTARDMHSWSNALDSDDSAFRGKAASLIQWRLQAAGDGMVDTYEQLTTRRGSIADAVGAAAYALDNFNQQMAGVWYNVPSLRDLPLRLIDQEVAAIYPYLDDSGLIIKRDTPLHSINTNPKYKLDSEPFLNDAEAGKAYIKSMLEKYPVDGQLVNLVTKEGWDVISRRVSRNITNVLKWLDLYAHNAIGPLGNAYTLAASALVEITPPPPETPPQPDMGAGGGGAGGGGIDGNNHVDVPPPPGGSAGGGGGAGGGGIDGDNHVDVPPPPGGSAGGGGGAGGADGVANLDVPPPPGSGAGGADGAAGGGNTDLAIPGGANGGGNTDLTGSGGANGMFVPGFTGPGTSSGGTGNRSATGPGADGAFGEPGAGDGLVVPPTGDAGASDNSLFPPGAGNSDTVIPPGSDFPGSGANGAAGSAGVGAGVGAGAGGFTFPPGADGGAGVGGGSGVGDGFGTGGGDGFGTDPGTLGIGRDGGFGAGGGAGGFGAGGGAGGFGAGGGAGGFGAGDGMGGFSGGNGFSTPAQFSGPPAPSGAENQAGGVPFYPPMMGGGGVGGAGDKPQERERQTWLSEDEEIWGTSVDVGSGVIGRLDEGAFEADEAPLVGPVRGQRRGDTPRRPRPEEKTAEATGEESSTASTN
jgi:hypothetical protein